MKNLLLVMAALVLGCGAEATPNAPEQAGEVQDAGAEVGTAADTAGTEVMSADVPAVDTKPDVAEISDVPPDVQGEVVATDVVKEVAVPDVAQEVDAVKEVDIAKEVDVPAEVDVPKEVVAPVDIVADVPKDVAPEVYVPDVPVQEVYVPDVVAEIVEDVPPPDVQPEVKVPPPLVCTTVVLVKGGSVDAFNCAASVPCPGKTGPDLVPATVVKDLWVQQFEVTIGEKYTEIGVPLPKTTNVYGAKTADLPYRTGNSYGEGSLYCAKLGARLPTIQEHRWITNNGKINVGPGCFAHVPKATACPVNTGIYVTMGASNGCDKKGVGDCFSDGTSTFNSPTFKAYVLDAETPKSLCSVGTFEHYDVLAPDTYYASAAKLKAATCDNMASSASKGAFRCVYDENPCK